MKVLVFANQKGGVGKTTSAISIAAALGIKGKKTLVIDFDPQGNASSGLGVRKPQVTSYDIIIGRRTAGDAIVKTKYKNLDVIPANMALAAAEFELADLENRESKLKTALEPIQEKYDYAVIDCPPSLGLLTLNALAAGDGVIIPMQCEYFSLEGLSQIMMTVKQVKKLYNPALTLTGILITMYNGRLNLSVSVLDELKKYYADKLFKTPIQRNVRISEAPSYGMPIQYYDKYSRGSLQYADVAAEIMERI
ncbi:MAG: ParA family protein [Clostridia bacterium]|jgi:chromosome partitioning protein|nr:ParA family protein [Clostridia bacterium]